MTIETQVRLTAHQQGGCVSGSVRVVTVKTALLGGFMNNSGLLDRFLDLPVTLETHLFTGGNQKISVFAGVRIVGGSARAGPGALRGQGVRAGGRRCGANSIRGLGGLRA